MYTTHDPTKICKENEVCYCSGCRNDPCRKDHSAKARERMRKRRRVWDKDWTPPRTLVDPTETQEHLLFLQRNGIGLAEVERLSGVSHQTIHMIRRGRKKFVWSTTANKILGVGTFGAKVDSRSTKWIDKVEEWAS